MSNKPLNHALLMQALTSLIHGNNYEETIVKMLPILPEIIDINHELYPVFNDILHNEQFLKTKKIHLSELTSEQATELNNFFEYLYFTSPDFMQEIK